VKAGLALVLLVLRVLGIVEVEPWTSVLVLAVCLLWVTVAMERAVLWVQCPADVTEVPSLVMLVTEGEVSRDLSWGESDNAGLLDMSAVDGEDVGVTISLPPGVEGDSDRLVMERDKVAMLASTVDSVVVVVAVDWEADVVRLVCLVLLVMLVLLVTMLGV
jgi:hypothetical protein